MDFSVFNTRRQSSISPPWCIIYYYRNKLDVAERGGGGPGANVPVGGLGISPSPPPQVLERSPFREVSLPLVAVQ